MPESPKLEQSAPQGRVTTSQSPPVPLSPLSFGDRAARKGAQEEPSEPGMGHGSQCLHVCKRLVLCKERKKERNTVAWVEPTQCNFPRGPALGGPGTENHSAFRPQTLCSALTHTPLQRAAHGRP